MTDTKEIDHTDFVFALRALRSQAERGDIEHTLLLGVLATAVDALKAQSATCAIQDSIIESQRGTINSGKQCIATLEDTVSLLRKIIDSQQEEITWLKASWRNRRTARKMDTESHDNPS